MNYSFNLNQKSHRLGRLFQGELGCCPRNMSYLAKHNSHQYRTFICATHISKLHTVFWGPACLSFLIHKPLLHWFPYSPSPARCLRVHLGFAATRSRISHMPSRGTTALGFPPTRISSFHSRPLLKAMTEWAHHRYYTCHSSRTRQKAFWIVL